MYTCFTTRQPVANVLFCSSLTGHGVRSQVRFTFSLQPYLKEGSGQNYLALFVRIALWRTSSLPEEIIDALQRNPEEAMAVTIWGERNGYFTSKVSDNSNLLKSVDLQSGSTYQMHFTKEGVCYYDIHVNFLSAGSTYLLITDIDRKLPGSHRTSIMFRLVCFIFEL